MKKALPYLLSGLLLLSMSANIFQFTVSRNQAAENTATRAQLQVQLDSVNSELATINAEAERLTLDYQQAQADDKALQAAVKPNGTEVTAAGATTEQPSASSTSKPVAPPATSKPETSKPVTPPANSKPTAPPKEDVVEAPAGGVFDVPIDDGLADASYEETINGKTGN